MCKSASFSPHPESVGAARHWAVAILSSSLDGEALGEAELCISELAANAVLHARTDFEVEICEGEARLRISVGDQSIDPVQPRNASVSDVAGRGLAIVAAVADEWGVIDNSPEGKVVWCTLRSR